MSWVARLTALMHSMTGRAPAPSSAPARPGLMLGPPSSSGALPEYDSRMKLVGWLQDLGKEDGGLAGGKAANLGEMLRAGLPVPPGFVVTTAAYDDFLAANGLREEGERLTRTSPPEAAAALEAPSQAIAARFAAGAMPKAAAPAVREAYARMGEPAVAVRSSATAEDLPDASFAGQMESYLNVRGEEALQS